MFPIVYHSRGFHDDTSRAGILANVGLNNLSKPKLTYNPGFQKLIHDFSIDPDNLLLCK